MLRQCLANAEKPHCLIRLLGTVIYTCSLKDLAKPMPQYLIREQAFGPCRKRINPVLPHVLGLQVGI